MKNQGQTLKYVFDTEFESLLEQFESSQFLFVI